MSMISTAIFRSLLLWLHLGIGPMIGAGPMRVRTGRPASVRARARRQSLPAMIKP